MTLKLRRFNIRDVHQHFNVASYAYGAKTCTNNIKSSDKAKNLGSNKVRVIPIFISFFTFETIVMIPKKS